MGAECICYNHPQGTDIAPICHVLQKVFIAVDSLYFLVCLLQLERELIDNTCSCFILRVPNGSRLCKLPRTNGPSQSACLPISLSSLQCLTDQP
jgi:hypothetical protein